MQAIIKRAEQAAMFIAMISVLAIMLVVSVDAIGRYALNSPLRWGFDLVTYYLMIVAVYFAISSTYQHSDHIAIDLIKTMVSKRTRFVFDLISTSLAIVVFALITYATFSSMIRAFDRQDMIPGFVLWPAWLSYAPIPVGAALLVLRLAHHFYMLVRYREDKFVMTGSEPTE